MTPMKATVAINHLWWRAECPCGWHGPSRYWQDEAAGDANSHHTHKLIATLDLRKSAA
jgi:hypothetical protein